MADWQFEYSIHTKADRATVWRYWTNMENLARLEPGVRRIELDGPFASGTTGRTVQDDYTQEWELADVIEGKRFTIMGYTRDASGWLSFSWTFEDQDGGTRMTQTIRAAGPHVDEYKDMFRKMAENAPNGMARLAVELDQLASGT